MNLESRTARFALLSSLGPDAPDTPLAKAQRAALFSRRPPQAPITLIRNGKAFKAPGDESTVRAGTEIEVKTERPQVTLSLAEMNLGSWVIFKFPGFTTAASGTEQPSLDALRKANATSYFRSGDTLWVKLVVAKPPLPIVRPTDLQASITVSKAQAVAAGGATGAGANAVGKS